MKLRADLNDSHSVFVEIKSQINGKRIPKTSSERAPVSHALIRLHKRTKKEWNHGSVKLSVPWRSDNVRSPELTDSIGSDMSIFTCGACDLNNANGSSLHFGLTDWRKRKEKNQITQSNTLDCETKCTRIVSLIHIPTYICVCVCVFGWMHLCTQCACPCRLTVHSATGPRPAR